MNSNKYKIRDSAIKTKCMFINRLLIILFYHLMLLANLSKNDVRKANSTAWNQY